MYKYASGMDPRPWDEGVFARARADTSAGMRSIRFWFFEVFGGGTVLAATSDYGSWWSFLFVTLTLLAGVVVLYLASLLPASFWQRNEARIDRLRLKEKLNALEGRTEPMPEGFVPIRRAAVFLVSVREPGNMGSDAAGCTHFACNVLVAAALRGEIQISGRRKDSPAFEPIESGYWKNARIDLMDLVAEDGSGGKTLIGVPSAGYRSYLDLCVKFDESVLRNLWPENRTKPDTAGVGG